MAAIAIEAPIPASALLYEAPAMLTSESAEALTHPYKVFMVENQGELVPSDIYLTAQDTVLQLNIHDATVSIHHGNRQQATKDTKTILSLIEKAKHPTIHPDAVLTMNIVKALSESFAQAKIDGHAAITDAAAGRAFGRPRLARMLFGEPYYSFYTYKPDTQADYSIQPTTALFLYRRAQSASTVEILSSEDGFQYHILPTETFFEPSQENQKIHRLSFTLGGGYSLGATPKTINAISSEDWEFSDTHPTIWLPHLAGITATQISRTTQEYFAAMAPQFDPRELLTVAA